MILGVELVFGCFQWTSQCETEKHASEGGNHDAKIKEAKNNQPERDQKPENWPNQIKHTLIIIIIIIIKKYLHE